MAQSKQLTRLAQPVGGREITLAPRRIEAVLGGRVLCGLGAFFAGLSFGEAQDEIAKAKGVQTPKVVLKEGDPARVIVNTGKREHADMIAMGSRGLSGVEGLLSGSVSYKVSHTATPRATTTAGSTSGH